MSFAHRPRVVAALPTIALALAVASLIGGIPGASIAQAQQGATQSTASRGTKVMQPADLKAWKTIRQSVLSHDGKWFAYVLAPNEGDASVIIRSTGTDDREYKFPIGDPSAGRRGAGGPPQLPDAVVSLAVSGDSKWAAYTIYPPATTGRAGRSRGAAQGTASTQTPPQHKLGLVNLTTGEKKEFDKVRTFAFNGEKPTWLAMRRYPEQPAAAQSTQSGGGRGAPSEAPASGRAEGTDLVLYDLATGDVVNVGNVAEFGFDDSGDWLAYTIDARDEIGNGVQIRNMRTDVVRAIDSDRALYRHLAWSDSTLSLAVLRGVVDTLARDTLFSVVAFTNIPAPMPTKTVFDPAQHSDFPADMKIADNRAPRLSDDLSAVFFGIRQRNPKPAASERTMAAGNGRANIVQAGAPGEGGTRNQPRLGPDTPDDVPSLVLWHHLDPRLQSQQIVQDSVDRAFNYLSEYRFTENKFVRLVDDALRTVTLTGHDHYAFGVDTRAYDQPAAYTGRRYEDVYGVDVKTGERKLLNKKHIPSVTLPSPNGNELLYWGDDANYWVLDLTTGAKRNITKSTGVNFANTEDDHNNLVPPPRPPFGWSKDGSSVLLSDGWDVWKVPTRGTGPATNLTVDGKAKQIRYQRLYAFQRIAGSERGRRGSGAGMLTTGIDLSQPLYVATYGEWTKKAGLSRVDPGTTGAKVLMWDDASFNFEKARDADVYLYTRQTSAEFPNYYVASADLESGRRITDANPQQRDFAWSSGVRLITYTSAKGDKLQAALYLPANYEPGKKYPLLVTIYEKRSQLANTYAVPSETNTPDRSNYTNRGYAVLDPDIVYRVNDPMMSAVWCVIPAVKAAIATGIVDSANIGLWGHSWGGSETGFIVTQTNLFKAAIAGAPLTNMVSMYASVYWNTGMSDASIFESSQGRFKGNVIDNLDAYLRNSSAFHAENVHTPLIILANDKDGAVDFNQGITYYNTLAQLDKDVILLEYIGENHGLARPVNQKDYSNRQREWFDHYLKGVPAPDWITKGIPRIKLEDELKARRDSTAAPPIVP